MSSLDNSENFKKKVAKNIKSLRERKNLTQSDMEDLGFGLRYYQMIESGTQNITLETIHKLAKALGVREEEFFKF